MVLGLFLNCLSLHFRKEKLSCAKDAVQSCSDQNSESYALDLLSDPRRSFNAHERHRMNIYFEKPREGNQPKDHVGRLSSYIFTNKDAMIETVRNSQKGIVFNRS